jgi:hypothetical protein
MITFNSDDPAGADLKYWDGITYDEMGIIETERNRRLKKKYGLCEACERNHAQRIIQSNYDLVDGTQKEKPYKLCAICLIKLVNHCLSPREYSNLIKNGHDPQEHMIHGDFYDEDFGTALQPNAPCDLCTSKGNDKCETCVRKERMCEEEDEE